MADYKNDILDDIILLAPRNYPTESRRTVDMLKHGDPAVISRWWDNIIHPIIRKHKQPEKYSRQYHLMLDEIIRELNAKSKVLSESQTTNMIVDQFREFLLFCKSELGLEKLPAISWFTHDDVGNAQPTFGSFHNEDQTIKIGINNRHILDVMRTLAHELCHFKQWTENRLHDKSGETGSNEENEANARAGVIMRKWNKSHPEMFAQKPIERKSMGEAWRHSSQKSMANKLKNSSLAMKRIKTDEDDDEVDSQEGVEEGWKSKVAGAALIGLGALGAAGHAKADDQGAGAKAPTQTSQAAGGLQWLDDPSVPDDLPGKVAGSRFPTKAPVGTKYGSFMNDKGEKINAYVDSDLTSRFVPDKQGEWKPQKFPTNAPVGTKYGTFTDKDGKKWDKYVGHDLTAVFKPAK